MDYNTISASSLMVLYLLSFLGCPHLQHPCSPGCSGFCQMKMWMNSGGTVNGGAASKPARLFLQVDQAQRVCGLASLDGPLCKGYLGQNGWAWYSQHLGDCGPFLQGSSCQKGSIVCNVIHCKLYTEEIHVIKAVHISEKPDPWPGLYHCFLTSIVSGNQPQLVWLNVITDIKQCEKYLLLYWLFAKPPLNYCCYTCQAFLLHFTGAVCNNEGQLKINFF